MSTVRLLAWKKGFNHPRRWDLELTDEGALFRETEGSDTIVIPARKATKIAILDQPFGVGPEEVRDKPTVLVKESVARWHFFGLAKDGVGILRSWLAGQLLAKAE